MECFSGFIFLSSSLDREGSKAHPKLGRQSTEGIHLTTLYILGLFGLMQRVLCGLICAKMKNDVHGGYGIAPRILLGCTFTTGIEQARFDPR